MSQYSMGRRQFIHITAGSGIALSLAQMVQAQESMATRVIPASGETIPVVGLGTSDEFEHLPAEGTAELNAVLTTLVNAGGKLVDTAPTYGNSESVLGQLFTETNLHQKLFMSTKISLGRGANSMHQAGKDQMTASAEILGKSPIDLILVHNLNDLDTQWQNLLDWKTAGKVRYIGVTVSQFGLFDRLEQFMRKAEGLDFVQLNYSLSEPRAEEILIPLAADKGTAVMINRPFGNGSFFGQVRDKQLPDWTAGFDCESWAQFSLKWILANPGVTCVIPATSNPRHMLDNARAGYGLLPDQDQRRRMLEWMQTL
jgi:aryl-alcohol dehydrogenase-like predicted oxidoreductase